ncbi:substrate-binding domain-containing protein [Oceanobacillus alkalisoli]|uniref:substrate-binding domain-containing protein n=1 Tax=Oceanobacillus alkalisoli TaxID=2925113 RepID=UPI001EE4B53A|nr:substrate-binding domain-containing protein [Oceanobacillus alkalisoli]MCG5102433.1 substrate-binding domain-containing protein [Oceanobacillus alkalisoli]
MHILMENIHKAFGANKVLRGVDFELKPGEIHALMGENGAHNDEMALGALEAIKAAGRDIVIIGFDGVEDAIVSVEAGELTATVAQQPDMMGQEAIAATESVLAGEELEEIIKVPLELKKK